ncbi:MAG: carboxypeptidase-like regulatory domain-containing protein [Bacteroidales bacterium]|jgi:hypothetical protein
MIKFIFILLFFNLNIVAYSQVIKGIVLERKTNNPVLATIYFSGTSVGTLSDLNGNFELDISKNNSMPLTISSVGYYSITLTDYTKVKPLIIYLTPKVFELKEVIISSKSLAGIRKACLNKFKDVFLGTTSNARNCEITNENDITFNYESDKDTLKAYASRPILITNRALGYKITYYLDRFEYIKKDRSIIFAGNLIFNEDLATKEPHDEVYERRRKEAYFGSRMHFFRALWADDLESAGFSVKNSANKYLRYKDIVEDSHTDSLNGHRKFLKYIESLSIFYNTRSSKIVFLKKGKVYFDKDGNFDQAGMYISWEGEMMDQRVGDMLPSEYDINPQSENQVPVPDRNKKNIDIPFEKVYLHLDRPYYSSGEDIWIKAYLVDALTNKLSDNSNNLYVELVSPDSKIIKQIILRMDKGTGAGDMHLEDSIASGNYQIRAYTSWMRNFGETFFFKKVIVIENQIGVTFLNQPNQDESNEKVDLQFFPEGGSLVENVNTVLGFKALNSSGYGSNINGFVVSSQGDTAASFTSTHFGMGSFVFISKPGLKYFAVGSDGNKISFKIELPAALKTGYSLNVSNVNKDFFQVNIRTNQATIDHFPIHKMVIIGKSHNSLCTTANVKIIGTDNSVVLSKKEFPEGIALLTLMDTTGKLYSERAFYIYSKEKYQINVIPDKKEYTPRQKVTLQVSVKDTSNNPVSANLSVSVVDVNQVKGFEKKQDIRSYLLLESEIRGHIEQPSYYFDTLNKDRHNALDNLLLTQGWRNFVRNYIPDTAIKFDYPIEKGITLSGTLRRKWGNKPIAGAKITMALLRNDNPSYKFTQTDSKGKYYLEGLNFTGPQVISVRATDKKNMGIGLISLDTVYNNTALVNYRSVYKLKTDVNEVSSYNEPSESREISDYTKEAAIKYNILKKYHLTDTIAIGEVIVNARRPVKENADGHFRSYGVPDYSLTVTDKMSGSHDPIQVLQGRTEGLYITGDSHQGYEFIFHGQKVAKGESPLFLLDDKEVDLSTICNVPIEAVDKIEYIKESGALAFYGFRGSFGVISVLTKRGINSSIPPVLNFITRRVYGYYQARTFYTPKYNIPQSEYNKPDLRTTIYWDPNVVTDKDGNATISFFNADSKAIIKVDIEGIVEPGIPLVGRSSFESK